MSMLFPVNLGGSLGTVGGGTSSLVLIDSHDFGVTATDTVDVVTTGYSEILLILTQANTPGVYGIRLSDDGGSTFYATSGDYIVSQVDVDSQLDKTAQTMFLWGAAKTTNDQIARLFPLSSSVAAHFYATGNSIEASLPGTVWATTRTDLVGAFDAIRFFSVSGNVTAGQLYVYGKVIVA